MIRSKITHTYELDDLAQASSELLGPLSDFPLDKNAAGILYCYSDMDLEPFVNMVGENVSFPVVGCTCIATVDSEDGMRNFSAGLLVLTSDDCSFSVAASGAVTPVNVREEITAAYQKSVGALPDKAKLLFTLPPYNLHIMLDEYTTLLNGLAEGIPVVGGLPSYNAQGDTNATFMNGDVCPACFVMLAISGDVRPVFSVQNVTGGNVERKRRVTKASANTVYTVGDRAFTDYMEEMGLSVTELTAENQTITFVSNPLLLENVEMHGNKNFSFVRTLHEIDPETGSGTAIGMIPEGATLSICSMNRQDIEKGSVAGMQELAAKMRENSDDGYRYSTVLAISCIGRHTVMLPESDAEAKGLLSALPAGLSLFGMYSYGEIGPLPLDEKNFINFAHNESLVLCAL